MLRNFSIKSEREIFEHIQSSTDHNKKLTSKPSSSGLPTADPGKNGRQVNIQNFISSYYTSMELEKTNPKEISYKNEVELVDSALRKEIDVKFQLYSREEPSPTYLRPQGETKPTYWGMDALGMRADPIPFP